jgi:hypothetical protein
MKAGAEYVWDGRTGRPLRLVVHPEASAFSVVHEIGHFLDHHALSDGSVYASAAGLVPEVMDALDQSTAVHTLRSLGQRRRAPIQVTARRRELHPVNQAHVRYLLVPREQFARAYAQFVAVQSGDAGIWADLTSRRSGLLEQVYHSQWEPTDFAPVEQAFDQLFRRHGWRT